MEKESNLRLITQKEEENVRELNEKDQEIADLLDDQLSRAFPTQVNIYMTPLRAELTQNLEKSI
jgi:hypothetical protein